MRDVVVPAESTTRDTTLSSVFLNNNSTINNIRLHMFEIPHVFDVPRAV
jgi:hypothetical protein